MVQLLHAFVHLHVVFFYYFILFLQLQILFHYFAITTIYFYHLLLHIQFLFLLFYELLLLTYQPHFASWLQLVDFIGHPVDLIAQYSFFTLQLIPDQFLFSVFIDVIRIHVSVPFDFLLQIVILVIITLYTVDLVLTVVLDSSARIASNSWFPVVIVTFSLDDMVSLNSVAIIQVSLIIQCHTQLFPHRIQHLFIEIVSSCFPYLVVTFGPAEHHVSL